MRKKFCLVFCVGFLLVATPVSWIFSQKSKDTSVDVKQNTFIGYLPVAEYDAPLPIDSKEAAIRTKRNQFRGLKLSSAEEARKFMITENSQSSYGGFGTHEQSEPAIPAGKAETIIVGEVAKASAFLTEGKVSVYSEFVVRISDVIKSQTPELLSIGDSITTFRGGGAIRFQSGKVINRLFGGRPMPVPGRNYVFFLKSNPETEDYSIITAYELRKGRVIPLDGIDIDGSVVIELSSHQTYKGISESKFFEIVRNAARNSQDILKGETYELFKSVFQSELILNLVSISVKSASQCTVRLYGDQYSIR